MRLSRHFLVFLFTTMATVCLAQQEKPHENVFLHPKKFYRKYMPWLHVKRNPPDTLYIKTYPNYLSVGMHVLSPAIQVNVRPRNVDNSKTLASNFRTNIPDIIGFSVSYRMVTAGFAFLTNSGLNKHDGYAPSKYRTATIRYNSTASAFQFKYLRIQGFTDINPSNLSNPAFPFRQRPDILSKEFQFENVYNFSWRKYSYVAPLIFSQRQVKSRAGFLLKAGVYYNQFSGDSTIITKTQDRQYQSFNNIEALRSVSLRIAPGFGANVIMKRKIYFSAAVFTSYDLYLYRYLLHDNQKTAGRAAGIFLIDGKTSLGYQSKRIYAGVRFETEQRFGVLRGIQTNMQYNYTGIEVGYRFDAPGALRKFYKNTMPPGM